MKKLVFVALESARSALAACSRNNQDAVKNAELNQPAAEELNELADAGANDAANAKRRARQPASSAAANRGGRHTQPNDEQEQNVSGM